MKDHEVAAAATDLIRDASSWITGNWCTNLEGKDKYCAEGAVHAVVGTYQKQTVVGALSNETRETWVQMDHTPATKHLHDQTERVIEQMAEVGREMYRDKIIFENGDDDTTVKDYSYIGLYDLNDAICDHDEVVALMEKTTAKLQEQDL